eukprot:8453320-Karenia_brevis.AAC.1
MHLRQPDLPSKAFLGVLQQPLWTTQVLGPMSALIVFAPEKLGSRSLDLFVCPVTLLVSKVLTLLASPTLSKLGRGSKSNARGPRWTRQKC